MFKKKILITGASGFIGKKVLQLLQKSKLYSIRVLVRNNSQLNNARDVEIIQGDLDNEHSLRAAIHTVDIIIHLAAVIQHKSNRRIFHVNVAGTQNLLRVCSQQPKKPHIIFISSENVLYQHQSAYGISKKNAELFVRQYPYHTILRFSVVFGKEDTINIGKILQSIKKRNWLCIPGDGKSLFQPIYIDDAAQSIVQVVKFYKKLNKRTLIIAGISPISFENFLRTFTKQLNKPLHVIHLPYLFCYCAAWGIEKIWPSFPIRASQIYNLNINRTYDIQETIKALRYSPRSVEQSIALCV